MAVLHHGRYPLIDCSRGDRKGVTCLNAPKILAGEVWRLEKNELWRNVSLHSGSTTIQLGYRSTYLCGISASLGFTADPRVTIERAANGLLKDAASLLLYQDVFKSPPAQAFLKVLLYLRRGDDSAKILESFGEFFKLMAIGRFPSWEDFILEGILCGEANPFAEAAANLGNPRGGIWSGGVPQSLRTAAAADLDCLQRLSITESTLSGWVADMVTDVRPEWRTAAALNFSYKVGPTYGTSSGPDNANDSVGFVTTDVKENKDSDFQKDSTEHFSIPSESNSSEGIDRGIMSSKSRGSGLSTSFGFVLHEDREMWREKIGGLWRWSEAVSMLEQYYNEHSAGRVASSQFLQWKGGKIALDPKWITTTIGTAADLTIHQPCREILLKNLTRHTQRHSAHHILLFGPSGSGKSWLLKSVLYKIASSCNLRILTLPVADLKNISLVLDELSRHWQLRFALVIDGLISRVGGDDYTLLKSALDGNGLDWPENVVMCATSSRELTIIPGIDDAVGGGILSHLFGLVSICEELEKDEFILCVKEVMENMKTNIAFGATLTPEELGSRAEKWASLRGGWSVRSAAQFVNSLY